MYLRPLDQAFQPADGMENAEENAVELHGDEEIIEVIELNDAEPSPGESQQNPNFFLKQTVVLSPVPS